MKSARRLPQRTCIACRSATGKRELVRVVRTPAGTVELDTTGKKAGRGAYLHERSECWDVALKKDRLSQALKTSISPDDLRALRQYADALTESVEVS